MQRTNATKPLFVLLAAAILALPAIPVSASGAATPSRLDDEVSQRIQTAAETQRIPVIVEGANDGFDRGNGARRAQRTEGRVRSSGGQVVGTSNLLGATVAALTPAEIRALSSDPSIARIHFDTEVKAANVGPADTSTGPTPIVFQQTVGATDAWRQGQTGRGVTIAVLDSGIDTNNPAFGARVKERVDFVNPTHPVQGDPAGHGTHVAGIVAAGRNAVSPGIAPDANLVSVRVLDANGKSRLSTVMLGLEWVVAHKQSLGIRVVVMALGAPTSGGYREDPLAAAAELAWRSGLVLVTAAGNNGPGAGTIQTPGIDPLILTVGASDDNGTATASDDSLPTWSSVGPTADGVTKPELVAPGRKIVSVRVPGSTLDLQSPSHVEGPTTIRFSGTSEAAAVAAGSAALLVAQRPELTPDQTKALLVNAALPLTGVAKAGQGAGLLNVARALAARTPRVESSHLRPAEGLLRALLPLLHNRDDEQVQGDQVRWDSFSWDSFSWDSFSWDQVRWDQVRWDQVRWDSFSWDQVRWDQVRWDSFSWDAVRWDAVRWDAVRWDQVVFD
jgi:serine protease AprX